MSNTPELDNVIADLNIDWSTELNERQKTALENIQRIVMDGGIAEYLTVLEINASTTDTIQIFCTHILTIRARIAEIGNEDPEAMFDDTNIPLITWEARNALKKEGGIVSRETAVSILERQSLDYASGIVHKLRAALKPNPSAELQYKIAKAYVSTDENILMLLFTECETLLQKGKIRNDSLEELAELVRQSDGDDKIAALQEFLKVFDSFTRSTI